jgi:hypothetical protein
MVLSTIPKDDQSESPPILTILTTLKAIVCTYVCKIEERTPRREYGERDIILAA